MWLRYGHVVLKLSIFVVQKASAPKNGVEIRQGSISAIRSSLATSYDVWRRRQFSTNQRPRNYLRYTDRQTENQHTVRPCSTSSACKNQIQLIISWKEQFKTSQIFLKRYSLTCTLQIGSWVVFHIQPTACNIYALVCTSVVLIWLIIGILSNFYWI